MTHVDHAHLLELALGNAGRSDDAVALQHLAVCVLCRQELTRVTRVVSAASDIDLSDLATPPPERLWERIQRELAEPPDRAKPPRSQSEQ
ncbi:hypothetical protein [Streptomyces sp. YS415]|uniref:hypothetical protein n=1 Tax=Streptomyces sp. YS415 TaxID=2944806 RepID=UPI002021FFAF|nr:hypothetical protein [Streptomyces sp. YS415]MCL7428030.1 hypothetical protein [Streptomyces sp. YS415]